MVDMEDVVVADGLVVFTSALDDLVVSWVVEVVEVPSLDAVLLTTAFADAVATSPK